MNFEQTEKESCKSCKYYNVGICRFNPPVALQIKAYKSHQPSVCENEWCGKYVKKEKSK